MFMKHATRKPSDLDWMREQILEFACGAHAFTLESDVRTQEGDWCAEFLVSFKKHTRQERLFCRAPAGGHHVRFWVVRELPPELWSAHQPTLLQTASDHDIGLTPISPQSDSATQRIQLSTRAWIPRFSQRIFGLTFSNLMDCKEAIDAACVEGE